MAAMHTTLRKDPHDQQPMEGWYASITTMQRRKVVVVMCPECRFGFALWGVNSAHFPKLGTLICGGIRTVLANYGVRQDLIDRYVPDGASPEMFSTSNRRASAQLAVVVRNMQNYHFPQQSEPAELIPRALYLAMNQSPFSYKTDGPYTIPVREMIPALERYFGEPPLSQTAMVLEASLDLERYTAMRTLVVPAEVSFSRLHDYLQIAFNWKDYHMREFLLPPQGLTADPLYVLPRMLIEMGDVEEIGISSYVREEETHLSDFLKDGDIFRYHYDFGDGWDVKIRVARVYENTTDLLPLCSLVAGKAPPEDVGGVSGFLNFLDILEDPENPEHWETLQWGSSYLLPFTPNATIITGRMQNI